MHKLKKVGIDCRIHETAILNNPELIEVGHHVAIDIGVYCSTQLTVGDYVHIAPYVCIIGGKGAMLTMGKLSGIAAGSKIVCASDDFTKKLLNPQIPRKYKNVINKPVIMEDFTCVGVNSVVMPGVTMKKGSVLGANSLLMNDTEEWGIYVGNPARKISVRDSQSVIENYISLDLNE